MQRGLAMLRRLFTGLSLRRACSSPRQVCMGHVACKMALEQTLLGVLFSSLFTFQQCYLLIYLLIYHRLYNILRICNLVTWHTYKTRTYKIQERLKEIFSKSIHTYIHTYIHRHIHIHSIDPVSASIASEYGTCQ